MLIKIIMQLIKSSILLYLLLLHIFSFGQESYRFIGFIKTQETGIVPYKISFRIDSSDSIFGESYFDFNGSSNTTSIIKGKTDAKRKSISFVEIRNVSSKSSSEQNDFCYLKVNDLKIKSSKENSIISGDFSSEFENGKKCVSGKLYLVSDDFLDNLEESISLQDSVSKKNETAYEILQQIRSNKVFLEKNQGIDILSSKKVELVVWDKHDADGDRISILMDGKVIERDLILSNNKKSYLLNCASKKCTLKILALNEGEFPPNTIEIELNDQKQVTPIVGKLKKGEAIFLHIRPEL